MLLNTCIHPPYQGGRRSFDPSLYTNHPKGMIGVDVPKGGFFGVPGVRGIIGSMKIFAIGRNYVEHARELGNEVPEEPVIFMKPSTALLGPGQAFVYPDFSNDIHYELELVLRVSRLVRQGTGGVAGDVCDAVSVGIDFTARDLQGMLKKKGLPWEVAKAFDGSASIGEFLEWDPTQSLSFSLLVNGEQRQSATSEQMIHGFDAIITHISKFFTIEPGDLIYTGTPSGVGPVSRGDLLEGFLGSQKLLTCGIV